jgi:hypothetical protein
MAVSYVRGDVVHETPKQKKKENDDVVADPDAA